jgi:hypothetical protein
VGRHLVRHTGAVVGHFDAQAPSPSQARADLHLRLRRRTGGFGGILQQVDQRLFQLAGIDHQIQRCRFLPLATLAIQRYLAGYVEQAPMGAWPLLAALTLAGLVALAATARHTLAALRISPALALR